MEDANYNADAELVKVLKHKYRQFQKDVGDNWAVYGIALTIFVGSLTAYFTAKSFWVTDPRTPETAEQQRLDFIKHVETNKGIHMDLTPEQVTQLTDFAKNNPHTFNHLVSKYLNTVNEQTPRR